MNFQVPQYIEVEDKIVGPLTFKQFLYVAGGAGTIFLIKVYFPLYIGVILMPIVLALTIALAFYSYNGRPFLTLLESMFYYTIGAKLYLWKKEPKKPVTKAALMAENPGLGIALPKLSNSKLKDLSWSLDVKETVK